ncbi:MAG: serine/threonine protein kinase [Proteobacteria bacterium]|nr:serine/threonine protein kinase [Pseudomonadota bacterium]
MTESQLLKRDLFGEVRRTTDNGVPVISRDCAGAATGLRWLARWLMRREASALAALADTDGVPELIRLQPDSLLRGYFAGQPMQLARPTDRAYFNNAAPLLRQVHSAGVAHNDLSKEPNFLVREDGSPAIIDFQLAATTRRRGKLFRLAAREDLRHLLKHKRTYCPQYLTARERHILDNLGWASIAVARTIKPAYLFVTRRLLGWEDREGAGDRGATQRTGTRR